MRFKSGREGESGDDYEMWGCFFFYCYYLIYLFLMSINLIDCNYGILFRTYLLNSQLKVYVLKK